MVTLSNPVALSAGYLLRPVSHPERSEGSRFFGRLRLPQNDKKWGSLRMTRRGSLRTRREVPQKKSEVPQKKSEAPQNDNRRLLASEIIFLTGSLSHSNDASPDLTIQ